MAAETTRGHCAVDGRELVWKTKKERRDCACVSVKLQHPMCAVKCFDCTRPLQHRPPPHSRLSHVCRSCVYRSPCYPTSLACVRAHGNTPRGVIILYNLLPSLSCFVCGCASAPLGPHIRLLLAGIGAAHPLPNVVRFSSPMSSHFVCVPTARRVDVVPHPLPLPLPAWPEPLVQTESEAGEGF